MDTHCIQMGDGIPIAVMTSARSGYQTPVSGAAYRDVMEAIVTIDSRGWLRTKYKKGSMKNVRIVNQDGEVTDVHGTYETDVGAPAVVGPEVLMRFRNGRLECIQYWDVGVCKRTFVEYHTKFPAATEAQYVAKQEEDARIARKLEAQEIARQQEYDNCVSLGGGPLFAAKECRERLDLKQKLEQKMGTNK